jgi:hypothetical protein
MPTTHITHATYDDDEFVELAALLAEDGLYLSAAATKETLFEHLLATARTKKAAQQKLGRGKDNDRIPPGDREGAYSEPTPVSRY